MILLKDLQLRLQGATSSIAKTQNREFQIHLLCSTKTLCQKKRKNYEAVFVYEKKKETNPPNFFLLVQTSQKEKMKFAQTPYFWLTSAVEIENKMKKNTSTLNSWIKANAGSNIITHKKLAFTKKLGFSLVNVTVK